jgi:hypothetical protein
MELLLVSRETFAELHRAFAEVARWPSPIREQVVRFYAGGTSRPDKPSPTAAVATASQPAEEWPEVWKPRSKRSSHCKPKPLRPHKPDRTRLLELELLEAMRDHPGASVSELAAIVGVIKSRALWRLHALANKAEVEKDPATGRWRLTGQCALGHNALGLQGLNAGG